MIDTNQQTDIELMSEWRWNRRPHLVKGRAKRGEQRGLLATGLLVMVTCLLSHNHSAIGRVLDLHG